MWEKLAHPLLHIFCIHFVLCAIIMRGSEDYAAELDLRRNALSVNSTSPQAAKRSVRRWEKRGNQWVLSFCPALYGTTPFTSLTPWEMGVSSPFHMWKAKGRKETWLALTGPGPSQPQGCANLCSYTGPGAQKARWYHLEISNNFISKFEFYEWSLTGQ